MLVHLYFPKAEFSVIPMTEAFQNIGLWFVTFFSYTNDNIIIQKYNAILQACPWGVS